MGLKSLLTDLESFDANNNSFFFHFYFNKFQKLLDFLLIISSLKELLNSITLLVLFSKTERFEIF